MTTLIAISQILVWLYFCLEKWFGNGIFLIVSQMLCKHAVMQALDIATLKISSEERRNTL